MNEANRQLHDTLAELLANGPGWKSTRAWERLWMLADALVAEHVRKAASARQVRVSARRNPIPVGRMLGGAAGEGPTHQDVRLDVAMAVLGRLLTRVDQRIEKGTFDLRSPDETRAWFDRTCAGILADHARARLEDAAPVIGEWSDVERAARLVARYEERTGGTAPAREPGETIEAWSRRLGIEEHRDARLRRATFADVIDAEGNPHSELTREMDTDSDLPSRWSLVAGEVSPDTHQLCREERIARFEVSSALIDAAAALSRSGERRRANAIVAREIRLHTVPVEDIHHPRHAFFDEGAFGGAVREALHGPHGIPRTDIEKARAVDRVHQAMTRLRRDLLIALPSLVDEEDLVGHRTLVNDLYQIRWDSGSDG